MSEDRSAFQTLWENGDRTKTGPRFLELRKSEYSRRPVRIEQDSRVGSVSNR